MSQQNVLVKIYFIFFLFFFIENALLIEYYLSILINTWLIQDTKQYQWYLINIHELCLKHSEIHYFTSWTLVATFSIYNKVKKFIQVQYSNTHGSE